MDGNRSLDRPEKFADVQCGEMGFDYRKHCPTESVFDFGWVHNVDGKCPNLINDIDGFQLNFSSKLDKCKLKKKFIKFNL